MKMVYPFSFFENYDIVVLVICMKKEFILKILLLCFLAFVLWYFLLPPFNFQSPLFWVYLFFVGILAVFFFGFHGIDKESMVALFFKGTRVQSHFSFVPFRIFGGMGIVILLLFGINFLNSPLFQSKKYATRIMVDSTHSFADDVALVDFSKTPLLDKESSQKLGDRIMGQATEWVSQFYVSDLYTQINYKDQIIRVTPIEYDDLFKYFANREEGIKGYIKVDSVNGASELVTLEKGMKYMPSSYFFENLYRKLRIDYPTLIFDEANFELDNDGNPYWIVPIVSYSGIGLRKDISGVVILNPITGESKKYLLDEIPSWVDHVFSPDLIIEQMDDWGEYGGGFINSIFGQKNVVNTTEGYNYLVMDDDVFLYTGITSVSSDESNLGFILSNLRTKETRYYIVPGAEEYSAMGSAEGLVQEKNYKASFPLLINLNGRPTYLLSLKDNVGLVKMYAFVDVADYQKVVVSDSSLGIEVAAQKYLGESFITSNPDKIDSKTIVIEEVTSAVIDGNTYYYITDNHKQLYFSSIKVNKELLPFLKKGDRVVVQCFNGPVSEIVNIQKEVG